MLSVARFPHKPFFCNVTWRYRTCFKEEQLYSLLVFRVKARKKTWSKWRMEVNFAGKNMKEGTNNVRPEILYFRDINPSTYDLIVDNWNINAFQDAMCIHVATCTGPPRSSKIFYHLIYQEHKTFTENLNMIY